MRKPTSRQLAARLDRLRRDKFAKGENFTEADFRGLPTARYQLRDCCLRGAKFERLNLQGARFINCDARYASFIGANLEGASLKESDLAYAHFDNANLVRADLRSTMLGFADFNGADLTDVELDFATWPLWCGSLNAKLDADTIRQFLYHIGGSCEHALPADAARIIIREANKWSGRYSHFLPELRAINVLTPPSS